MNIKRIFGAILTLLGIAFLITAAVTFNSTTNSHEYKSLITYAVLGLIFFSSGIGLVKTTSDEA